MVDRKPSYDELRDSLRDREQYCQMIHTLICLAGAALYFFFLKEIWYIGFPGATMDPADNLPLFLFAVAYLFLFLYGLWHVFSRLMDIWTDDLNFAVVSICDSIDRFFRAFARALNSLNEPEERPKKEQTTLPVDRP